MDLIFDNLKACAEHIERLSEKTGQDLISVWSLSPWASLRQVVRP